MKWFSNAPASEPVVRGRPERAGGREAEPSSPVDDIIFQQQLPPVYAALEPVLRLLDKCGRQSVRHALAHAVTGRVRESADSRMDDAFIGRELAGGRFLLTRLLGEGGMGRVYVARDRQEGSLVAVKIVAEPDDELRDLFQREAREHEQLAEYAAARGLKGICPVVARHGDGEPVLFLAMRYLGNALPLDACCRQRDLNLSDRIELFLKVLDAVKVVHDLGTAHRDLKPDNILVDRDGQPWLVDFGLAKKLTPGRSVAELTRTGQRRGTPLYMSPEQVRGEKFVGAPSDIFSLGRILWSLLGRPVDELDLSRPHPPLSSVLPISAGPLSELVAECLQYPEDQRPSIALMISELRTVSGSLGRWTVRASGRVGKRIDAHELAELLGRGLIGETWRTSYNGRAEVLKLSRLPWQLDADAIRDMEQRLGSRWLVGVKEVRHPQFSVLHRQFIAGRPAVDVAATLHKPDRLLFAVVVFHDVLVLLDGLASHRLPPHGNIKPGNVIVRDPAPRSVGPGSRDLIALLDYGIRFLDPEASDTFTVVFREIQLAMHYRSPLLSDGQDDANADLYAAGRLLGHLIAGKLVTSEQEVHRHNEWADGRPLEFFARACGASYTEAAVPDLLRDVRDYLEKRAAATAVLNLLVHEQNLSFDKHQTRVAEAVDKALAGGLDTRFEPEAAAAAAIASERGRPFSGCGPADKCWTRALEAKHPEALAWHLLHGDEAAARSALASVPDLGGGGGKDATTAMSTAPSPSVGVGATTLPAWASLSPSHRYAAGLAEWARGRRDNAVHHMRAAAEAGHVDAMYRLTGMLSPGATDTGAAAAAEAGRWLERAARSGHHGDALYRLARRELEEPSRHFVAWAAADSTVARAAAAGSIDALRAAMACTDTPRRAAEADWKTTLFDGWRGKPDATCVWLHARALRRQGDDAAALTRYWEAYRLGRPMALIDWALLQSKDPNGPRWAEFRNLPPDTLPLPIVTVQAAAFHWGWGGPVDRTMAFDLLGRAVKKGEPVACLLQARMLTPDGAAPSELARKAVETAIAHGCAGRRAELYPVYKAVSAMVGGSNPLTAPANAQLVRQPRGAAVRAIRWVTGRRRASAVADLLVLESGDAVAADEAKVLSAWESAARRHTGARVACALRMQKSCKTMKDLAFLAHFLDDAQGPYATFVREYINAQPLAELLRPLQPIRLPDRTR
jgi:TPR repeat protein